MLKQATKTDGRYLYAIVAGCEDHMYSSLGIDGSDVYSISDGQLTAVVSDVPNTPIRPERRNLAAHQEVLKRLMEDSALLPMSFGIIADGPDDVRRILSLNQVEFLDQLQRVAGKVEMCLRISWDLPNVFAYLVDTHPELQDARDQAFRGNHEPSQETKIELGRLFDRILTEDRIKHTTIATDILWSQCFEIVRNKPRNEHEVMNLACLIGRDSQEEFEQSIFELARFFDDNYSVDYSGPWPPYSFVQMSLCV